MRDFKFRAWSETEGEFIVDYDTGDCSPIEFDNEGGVRVMQKNLTCYCSPEGCGGCADKYDEVKDAVVMQYTGLKDKNGVEIYEGDMLASPHFKTAAGKSCYLRHIVEWSEKYMGWFLLSARSLDHQDGSIQMWVGKINTNCKVIGNIHENPELLKA